MAKDASDSEITELDDVLLREEDVLALDIAMKNLTVVHVLHAQTYLREPVHDLRLGKVATSLVRNQFGDVATICVVHHNT